MRIALDTNILVYVEGVNGELRAQQARVLLRKLSHETLVVASQALGELFNVLVKKAGRTGDVARASCMTWRDASEVEETSSQTMFLAMDLAVDHGLSIWDSVIIVTALAANCRILLSEDLQHGFTRGGITVVNPFREPVHPLLAAVMDDTSGAAR